MVTRIGITGHRGLDPAVTAWVRAALAADLSQAGDGLAGVTCLADGADQLFARTVLQAGGRLHVIVPARRYREGLPADCHGEYDDLLAAATAVEHLDHEESTEHAHMDASAAMIGQVDRLVAVWDGLPARGFGGTADVVDLARHHRIPVTIHWPQGAVRT
jgi:hypothetical protein